LVLLLAWETLFPTMGPLPVTSHTRAMWTLRLIRPVQKCAGLTSPRERVAVTPRRWLSGTCRTPSWKGGPSRGEFSKASNY